MADGPRVPGGGEEILRAARGLWEGAPATLNIVKHGLLFSFELGLPRISGGARGALSLLRFPKAVDAGLDRADGSVQLSPTRSSGWRGVKRK